MNTNTNINVFTLICSWNWDNSKETAIVLSLKSSDGGETVEYNDGNKEIQSNNDSYAKNENVTVTAVDTKESHK